MSNEKSNSVETAEAKPGCAPATGSASRPKTRNYYVEGTGWFVVTAANKKRAHSVGVEEYGRGNVRCVREATEDETKSFISQKGENALRE